MNKVIIPILAVLIIAAAVLAARIKGTDTTSAPHESLNPGGGISYAMADVAKHADRTSCWTAINGNVYDVTSWIDQHPGGPEAILFICGKDGSAAFNDQHGGQRRPAQELAGFLIGSLAQ
jgi:cytochrome b involved in lipid metabolism